MFGPPNPPVPPGAPPPPGGALNPLPVPIAVDPGTYTELYTNMPDALNGEYAAFMANFVEGSAVQLAMLRDNCVQANETVPLVLLCMTDVDPPLARVMFKPHRYHSTIGVASPWDNNCYAFVSDVGVGNQIANVDFPPTAFHLTAQQRVPTLAELENQWTAAVGADCVGPYVPADANTELVQTRQMMLVPPCYVPMVMARLGTGFTPRQLCTDLLPLIEVDGNMAACAPLIDWIQVASAYSGQPANAGDPPALPLVHGTVFNSPVADASLQRDIWHTVTTSLPALDQCSSTTTTAIQATMGALTQQVQMSREEQNARAA